MFSLKVKKNRNPDFLVRADVIATYTLDQSYIQTYELSGEPSEILKIQPGGSVVALHPTTQKVVPNYTSYGFEAVGILLEDAFLGESSQDYHDKEVDVLWRGIVFEKYLWDNGLYGSVVTATKTTLADRISFVKETGQTRW